MKTKLIAAAAILAAVFISGSETPIYAGQGGGHGGGGFSVGSGGGRGGGNYSSGGGGFSRGYGGGYSGGYHSYGTMRGYTGGGFSRIYSGGGQSYGSSQGHIYTSQPANRTVTGSRQSYSSQTSYGQHVNRSGSVINRTDRVAKNDQFRGAYGNRGVQRDARTGFVGKQGLTTRDGRTHQGNWARNNSRNANRFDQKTQDRLQNWNGNKSSWAEANQRNHGNHDGHHHGHDWWHNHCGAIIVVGGGWWGWWDGWWYPAWGYDPYYQSYAYDGPVYGYGGLPPDEVIANVQSELQRLGYFSYAVDGVLGPLTQEALRRYQRDRGLPITGAVDADTVGSLGLSS